MTPPVDARVRDLRLDRRALRAEQALVGWWRRLVRARLDLAVASAARPTALGEDIAFQLPVEVGVRVPRPPELDAVLGGSSPSELEDLEALRSLDARLASYEQGVHEALATTTEALIARLASDPAATAELASEALGRG